ncbi:hypothetical protein [Chitinimonas naiadis]
MPVRKNLAERLELMAGDDEDDVDAADWSYGVCWGVFVRPQGNSAEQIPCGVVVRVDGPGHKDYLYDFASLAPLTTILGKGKVAHLEDLMKRTRHALDQGDEVSPVPSAVVYGESTPWRYETAELAVHRLWQSHVSKMLIPKPSAPAKKTQAEVIEAPSGTKKKQA